MSVLQSQPIASGTVATPPTGFVSCFIDSADNVFKGKNDAGAIIALVPAVAPNGITNALLAQIPTLTIKGNNTGGTANVIDLTVAQVTAMLNNFTSLLKGLVPASGGGTVNFLRADGTFVDPLPTISEVVQTANATNASTSDAVISGLTLTPVAGSYTVDFNTTVDSTTNARTHTFSIYVNGIIVASSVRQTYTDTAKFQNISISTGKITVNGSQAIDVRWAISGGTGTIYQRVFKLTKCQ